MTSKVVALKKQRGIDETEMEEEEGKREKGVVGCRIYKEWKDAASSGHKLMVSAACKPRAFLLSGTYPICISVVIIIKDPLSAKMR